MEVRPRPWSRAARSDSSAAERRPTGHFLRGYPPARIDARRTLLALAAVGLVGLVAASLLGDSGWRAYQRLRAERAAVAAEVDSLRLRQRDLDQRIHDVRHDPATLERLARERYSMHIPGEQIIEVLGEENLEGKLPVAPPLGTRPLLGAPPASEPGKAAAGKPAAGKTSVGKTAPGKSAPGKSAPGTAAGATAARREAKAPLKAPAKTTTKAPGAAPAERPRQP